MNVNRLARALEPCDFSHGRFSPLTIAGKFYDDNNVLEMQNSANGYYINVMLLPISLKTIKFVPFEEHEQSSNIETFNINIENYIVESNHYIIIWDDFGRLTSIYDKDFNREVINGFGNNLIVFDNIQTSTCKKNQIYTSKNPTVIEQGNLKCEIHFEYMYNNSMITVDMVLYKNSRRIDFKTFVNWNEDDKVLITAFDVDIRTTKARFDTQYGFVERPTHYNNSDCFYETYAHTWADLSDNSYGISLINNCKYEYIIKDNNISLCLLRSSKYMDKGIHNFVYSLYPHQGSIPESDVFKESSNINLPVQILQDTELVYDKRILLIDSDKIKVDAVKKSENENCVVVRLHEATGCLVKALIKTEFNIKCWVPCNILEDSIGDEIFSDEINIVFKPFEIKNYKLYF